jgi:hypothetical protein
MRLAYIAWGGRVDATRVLGFGYRLEQGVWRAYTRPEAAGRLPRCRDVREADAQSAVSDPLGAPDAALTNVSNPTLSRPSEALLSARLGHKSAVAQCVLSVRANGVPAYRFVLGAAASGLSPQRAAETMAIRW